MTSSERILAGIAEEGEKQSAEIIAKAEAEAKEAIDQAESAAKAEAETIINSAEKKAQLIRSSGKSAAQLLKRDAALKVRRELIGKVLEETADAVCALPDEEYFAFLLPLIERGRMQGNGELLLSAHDLARDTADFSKKLALLSLTIAETPADIHGGFILKYNDIFINGELSALIREKHEELVDSVNSILFL